MVRLTVLFVALLLIGSCAGVGTHNTPYGFEPGDLIEGVPVGWHGSSGDPAKTIVGIDRTIKHGGLCSFAFQSNDSDVITQFNQVIQPGEYAGHRVRFQAYVRTRGVRDSAGLWLRADTKDKACVAFDNMLKRRIKGTTEWDCYSIVVDIPENARSIHYGILLEGRGQVWIDDCSFEIVGDEVWATARMSKGFDRKHRTSGWTLRYPANLGFEGGAGQRQAWH